MSPEEQFYIISEIKRIRNKLNGIYEIITKEKTIKKEIKETKEEKSQ